MQPHPSSSRSGKHKWNAAAIWQALLYYRHLQIQLIKSLQASHHNEVVDRESREFYDSSKW